MRGNRRGFRRRFFIGLVALPIAAALLGNLWLACPPGRAWLAAKIQRRTGLETLIGSASISPWNGVSIRRVELLQPPPLRMAVKVPLARIDAIRLAPVWRSWLRGGYELQSVEFDSPRLVVPLELLADLARSQSGPTTPAAPPVAAVAPPPAASPPPATPVAPAPPTAPAAPPDAPAAILHPTAWLHLKNASFTLLSAASGKPGFEISGVTGSLPVAGSPAESGLHIGAVLVAGREILTDLKTTVDWKNPLLSMKPVQTQMDGFQLILAGKLAMLSGLPVQIEAQAPKQKPKSIPLPAGGHAEAESVFANARFRGLLLAPGSWQGDLVVETLNPSATLSGHDAKFDRGSAVTVLRGGILSCVDARLIGDELSFLGNATLLADGRLAAALRMVAPPDSATAIASRLFPNVTQPSLTPLSSPQRAAFDLEAFGNIGQIHLRLGKDGPIVELKTLKPSP